MEVYQVDEETDLLELWIKSQSIYSHLSPAAMDHLCIPASSIPETGLKTII